MVLSVPNDSMVVMALPKWAWDPHLVPAVHAPKECLGPEGRTTKNHHLSLSKMPNATNLDQPERMEMTVFLLET